MACGCRKTGAQSRRVLTEDALAGSPSPHILRGPNGTETTYPTREEAYKANAETGYQGVVRKA